MQYFHAVRELVTPLSNSSSLKQTGRITPKEFVEAGDFLVYKCPTWQWSGGEPSKRRSYLPADKQYLVTRNVPCAERCTENQFKYPVHEDGEWTVYEEAFDKIPVVDIDEVCEKRVTLCESSSGDVMKGNNDDIVAGRSENHDETKAWPEDDDDYYNVDEMEDVVSSENVVKTRRYDIYITWDKYYQTPRVWLYGYSESKTPLSKDEMFQDVSAEHAHKTVTYEYHPHENYQTLSIHPCKHASVMKKILWKRDSRRDAEPIRAEQYMCIFLKFIATVIPTIAYDFSMAI